MAIPRATCIVNKVFSKIWVTFLFFKMTNVECRFLTPGTLYPINKLENTASLAWNQLIVFWFRNLSLSEGVCKIEERLLWEHRTTHLQAREWGEANASQKPFQTFCLISNGDKDERPVCLSGSMWVHFQQKNGDAHCTLIGFVSIMGVMAKQAIF